MMVTRRSSSSEVSSPARFFRSTSAFLQTRLAIQRRQYCHRLELRVVEETLATRAVKNS
jgi:hypothetical protein